MHPVTHYPPQLPFSNIETILNPFNHLPVFGTVRLGQVR